MAVAPQGDPPPHYDQLLASIAAVIWEADPQTLQFTFVSQHAEQLLGYSFDRWRSPGFWVRHLHPEDRDRVVEACRRAADERRCCELEYRLLAADGRAIWLRTPVSVVADAQGATRLCGAMLDITAHKGADEALHAAEQGRLKHLRFLESLDQVNRALQATSDVEQMLADALESMLQIFACDRAWLIFPCEPGATSLQVARECTRPEYPGASALGCEVPIDRELAAMVDTLRASPGPAQFGPGAPHALPAEVARQFSIQSCLAMALRLKAEQTWLLGLHQCACPRMWTPEEERLFQEIGRRLGDALTIRLAYRDVQESKRKLEEAGRIAHVGYWDRDFIAGRITMSGEAYRIFGLSPQEPFKELSAWNKQWLQLIHPQDLARTSQAVADALEGRKRYDVEYRVIQPGGEVRMVSSVGDVTRDETGRPVRMFGIMQDISALRQTEAELHASEARFRTLVDHATDAFFLHDEEGVILDVNRQACESLGYSREELIGLGPATFDAALAPDALAQLRERLDDHEVIAFDSLHRRKDGSVFPVEVRVRPIVQGGRRFAVSLARDITERKRAEQALVESYNLLQAVVEGTPDAVFVKDREGRYLMINCAGAHLLGKSVEEVIGNDDRALFAPDVACAIIERDRRVMAAGKLETFEESVTVGGVAHTYLATRDVYRDAAGIVIGLIGISRDVTELKRLEAQFRQAQKMEAVGRLAGGVAHDFNNLLTIIIGNCELLNSSLPADDPGHELLAEVQRASDRAVKVTSQLLAFSRKQMLQPEVVCLNVLLGDLLKLLRRLIGEDIELALVPSAELGLVRVDPGQFEQAIINLVVNARDAMPEGGKLLIEANNVELDADYAGLHPEVRPGQYILVAVSDTGHGMDEATRSRIFEPFFTTKEQGKGTGLGLAMVYGFVTQSGGHVEVYSEQGHGTTCKVYLPCVEDDRLTTGHASEVVGTSRGTETVLVVEDEAPLRDLVRLILQSNGYRVLEAQDGQEALWVAQQHQGPIHLLLTDLVMPRMSGRQLAELLAAHRPGIHILFMSGYAEEAVVRHGVLESHFAYLQKPFNSLGLTRKVRAALDGERPGRSTDEGAAPPGD